MDKQRSLSLSVGDLKCDVVGFEDPIAILDRVVELFADSEPGGVWAQRSGAPGGKALRAGFEDIARTIAEANGADLSVEEGRLRFVSKPQPAPAAQEPRACISQVFKAPPGFADEVEKMRAMLQQEEPAATRAGEKPPMPPGAITPPKPINPATPRTAPSRKGPPPIPCATFLRGADTSSLTNLLEAAAAWLAVSEGKTIFSSHDALTALTAMEGAAGLTGKYDWSARKSAFLDLVETQSFQVIDEGKFTLSLDTLFAYEQRLRA